MTARAPLRQIRLDIDDTAITREDSVNCSSSGCSNRIMKLELQRTPTRTPFCDMHRCNSVDDEGQRCASAKEYGSNYCAVHATTISPFADATDPVEDESGPGPETVDMAPGAIHLTDGLDADSLGDEALADALAFLKNLDVKGITFSSKITETVQHFPNRLKGFATEMYGFRLDISVQVSMALHLMNLVTRDPDIIESTREKLAGSRNTTDFHQALYLSILEKWNRNQK